MRILIVEDEILATDRLTRLLKQLDASIEIVGCSESITDASAWLSNHPAPDALLLDIHLADGSGFDLLPEVPASVSVVFTTAYDAYAVEAFRVQAVDYLLKPVKEAELARAIERIRAKLRSAEMTDAAKTEAAEQTNQTFLVKRGTAYKVLEINDIAYFVSQDKVTLLTAWDGRRYPIEPSLEKLETSLDPRLFTRVNRQCILHYKAIQSLQQHTKGRLRVITEPSSDLELTISSEKTPAFKKWVKMPR